MTQKKALVTGSTGFVGSHLCKELLENGYSVRALHRASSDLSTIADLNVERFEGDITDPDSLQRAMKGIDCVFHIAALFREAKHGDEVYWNVNVEGTKNVLQAAKEQGVKRVIHCSTVGVHSHIPNPPADENEAYRPGDIYQETKCEGEKIAREWFSSGKIEGAIIRPAMIWGPGDKRMLKLFRGIKKRKLPLVGFGSVFTHWVHVDDLARAFRLAAETPEATGQTYIIAGERAVTMKDLFSEIAKAEGVSLLPVRLPAFPIQLLGTVMEKVCIPLGIEPPIYRRRVDFFTKTRSFDWSKAKRELGYNPACSFEDEVRGIAGWYLKQGWI